MTLESQYKLYIEQNPNHSHWTYVEWLRWHSDQIAEAIKSLEITISDDFQIGPDGAYEATDEFELYERYCDQFVGHADIPSYEWFLHELKNNSAFKEKYGKSNNRI